MTRVPLLIAAAVFLTLAAGSALFIHARGATNAVALSSLPKGVTVAAAAAAKWRPTHRYVGTVEPWLEARLGPQLVSAYVDTVLVRAGAAVTRGQVVATLDCRNVTAMARAVDEQARALARTQAAVASQAARMTGLLGGGFVSPDELEQRQAESESKGAQVLALRAQALGSSLQVQDCILRAPFDGEVIERFADPGAFMRPGSAVATLVDRHLVRISADVPEEDFEAIAPGSPVAIHLLATNRDLTGVIARRAPGADPSTRTIHLEIDLPNPLRELPVGTSAELRIESGVAVPATRVPLTAATVRGEAANLFVIEDGVARAKSIRLLGERDGSFFLDGALPAGALVVTEGRGALAEGDRVSAGPPRGETAARVQQ